MFQPWEADIDVNSKDLKVLNKGLKTEPYSGRKEEWKQFDSSCLFVLYWDYNYKKWSGLNNRMNFISSLRLIFVVSKKSKQKKV